MIKNIIIIFLTSFSLILPVNAQDFSSPKLNATIFLDKPHPTENESLLIERKDAEIRIGNGLTLKSPFVDRGEYAPKQGWILSIGHLIRIQKFVEGCKNTCTILNDVIIKDYAEKLKTCQSDCDKRINKITDENFNLKQKNSSLSKELNSEKKSKIMWSIISAISGSGIGILIYSIAK
tara:strand:- start:920 stop:1453 length:534 start_codon:yes stop_codon:yes gene_type:complete